MFSSRTPQDMFTRICLQRGQAQVTNARPPPIFMSPVEIAPRVLWCGVVNDYANYTELELE